MGPARLPYDVLWDIFNEVDYGDGLRGVETHGGEWRILETMRATCCLWRDAAADSDSYAAYRIDAVGYRVAAFQGACRAGDLRAAKYVYRVFSPSLEDMRADDLAALWGACENGHAHVVRWLAGVGITADDVRSWNNKLLANVCRHYGHLHVARALHETFELTRKDVTDWGCDSFRGACSKGRLEIAQWLHETFRLKTKDARLSRNAAFRMACKHGHLAVVRWLHETFGLTYEDTKLHEGCGLQLACSKGQLEVAQWLRETFDPPIESMRAAFVSACENGHLPGAMWLRETAGLTSEDARTLNNRALQGACKNGHLKTVNWLCRTFDLWPDFIQNNPDWTHEGRYTM